MTDANVTKAREGADRAGSRFVALAREWMLRREALARAPSLLPVQRERRERSRAAAALGDACLSADVPDDALTRGAAPALALSLYREAAYWALAARTPDALPGDLAAAFERDPSAARAAAGGEEDDQLVRDALVNRTYRETAELGAEEQALDASVACAFVHVLLDELDARERLLLERWTRVGWSGLMVLLLFVVLPVAGYVSRPSLAEKSAWRASSAAVGFERSGRGFQPLTGAARAFFHTDTEASPWVEFDLGASVPVSKVTVENREDCCQERAVPLAVELSADGREWAEVARRVETFETWTASFPRHSTRFVRLRSLRPTMLHLASVEIR